MPMMVVEKVVWCQRRHWPFFNMTGWPYEAMLRYTVGGRFLAGIPKELCDKCLLELFLFVLS